MSVRGENLIGSLSVQGKGASFFAYNPSDQADGELAFHAADLGQLDQACALAAVAAQTYGDAPREQRADFLDDIASGLLGVEEDIVASGMAETGLPEVRLRGELQRTVNQLRMFAGVLRDGAYLDVRVDHALPDRAPPRPDIRLMNRPIGPVAVFGASNFPLAFSVAGGDTASALAAGCPVIVKAHSAHPATSEIVGRAVQGAVAKAGLPEGVFSLLFGGGRDIGQALVADARVQAVGFTGSQYAGTQLSQVAQKRPIPIPVYAEMSSINPVLLLPAALKSRGAEIGKAFVGAQMMGAGQFCTSPGLLLGIDGPDLDAFLAGAAEAYVGSAGGVMLTKGIHTSYCEGVDSLIANGKVELIASGKAAAGLTCQPRLFAMDAENFLGDDLLAQEVFGSASLVVRCRDQAQFTKVVEGLEGQLTAALHVDEADHDMAAPLVALLEKRCGRVIFNGFGTGVEVCDAMVHGGPYPATTDTRTTSVGSLAIMRFVRPVCYQDVPSVLLPEELREENLSQIPHRCDGQSRLP